MEYANKRITYSVNTSNLDLDSLFCRLQCKFECLVWFFMWWIFYYSGCFSWAGPSARARKVIICDLRRAPEESRQNEKRQDGHAKWVAGGRQFSEWKCYSAVSFPPWSHCFFLFSLIVSFFTYILLYFYYKITFWKRERWVAKSCVYITVWKTWKGSRHYTPSHTPSWTVWRIHALVKENISTF